MTTFELSWIFLGCTVGGSLQSRKEEEESILWPVAFQVLNLLD